MPTPAEAFLASFPAIEGQELSLVDADRLAPEQYPLDRVLIFSGPVGKLPTGFTSLDLATGKIQAPLPEIAEWLKSIHQVWVDSGESREFARYFDFSEKYAAARAPATPVLIAVCVALFGVLTLSGGSTSALVLLRFGAANGVLIQAGEWWRLVGSTFLHIGLTHLAVNMLALWVLGRQIERFYGTGPFLGLYALAGLSGSLASQVFMPDVIAAGASGAIFGLFGAAGVLSLKSNLPRAVALSMRKSALINLALNVGVGLSVPNIGHAAHLGGLVAGALFGALVPTIFRPRPAWLAPALALVGALPFLVELIVLYHALHPVTATRPHQLGPLTVQVPATMQPREGALVGPPGVLVFESTPERSLELEPLVPRASRIGPRTVDGWPWLVFRAENKHLSMVGAVTLAGGEALVVLAGASGEQEALRLLDSVLAAARLSLPDWERRLGAVDSARSLRLELKSLPAEPAAWELAGRLALSFGDPKLALECFSRLKSPDRVLLERAQAYQQAGQLALAGQDWERALKLCRNDEQRAGVRNHRAWYQALTGQSEQAVQEATAALALKPSSSLRARTLDTRAFAYLALKRYGEAEADLAEARKLSPKETYLLLRQAQLDDARGKKAEAIQGYREFLSRDPEDDDAPAAQKRLEALSAGSSDSRK